MKLANLVIVTAGFSALGGAVATKRADACVPPQPCPTLRYPSDGATLVPTNTKLWTTYNGALTVRDADDNVIHADLPIVDTQPLVSLPAALAPNTEYHVSVSPDSGHSDCATYTYSFTTGFGPDDVPLPPVISEFTTEFVSSEEAGPCPPSGNHVIVSLELAPRATTDTVAHRVYVPENELHFAFMREFVLPAMPSFAVPGTEFNESYEVVAVSASGVESDTAPIVPEPPPSDGEQPKGNVGCAVQGGLAHGGGGGGGALAVMAAVGAWVGLRRRRA